MKPVPFVSGCLGCFLAFAVAAPCTLYSAGESTNGSINEAVAHAIETLPLSFERNVGQAGSAVQFLARTQAFTAFLAGPDVAFVPNAGAADAVRLTFVHANPNVRAEGLEQQPGRVSYFTGADASKWRTNVALYGRVLLHELYPGIDAVFYGREQDLEYDLIIRPGADPNQVKLRFRGAEAIRLNEAGDLMVESGGAQWTHHRPRMYQVIDGGHTAVEGAFVVTGKNEIGFRTRPVRRDAALVIDPVVTYASYFGGSLQDAGFKIRTDSAGAIYVMGSTASFADFPSGLGFAFGDLDIQPGAFIAKFSADGKSLIYRIIFSRSGGGLTPAGFAVDWLGQTYLTGSVQAPGLPVVPENAIQEFSKSTTAFVAKFDASGSRLIYSTYLGGSNSAVKPGFGLDLATDLAVDASGDAYVVGYTESMDFPLKNPFQSTTGGRSAFVSKLNPTGTALIFSTYLGQGVYKDGVHVAVDAQENVYVTGRTIDGNFPVTAGAFQTQRTTNIGPGGVTAAPDAFIAKLNPSGTALAFSTYFGGGGADGNYTEVINGIAADGAGNVYLTGWTDSPRFPQAAAPAGSACGPAATPFFTKLDGSGARLIYSWCEGLANGAGQGAAIAPDSAQNAYATFFSQLSTEPAAKVVVRKLNAAGQVVAQQELNGSAAEYPFDLTLAAGHIVYVTGETFSDDLPVVNAYQPVNHGGGDVFVAAIDFADQTPAATFTRIDQTSSAVTYAGRWYAVGHPAFTNGAAAAAMIPGFGATFTFTGTAAKWIGYKDPWSGMANVYVDGVLKARVDAYSASGKLQTELFAIAGLKAGTHTLRIEVAGAKNPASNAFWIWIDGFEYRP